MNRFIIISFLSLLLYVHVCQAQSSRGNQMPVDDEQPTKPEQNVALIIGTDHYHGSKKWHDLSNAVFDARTLKVTLHDRYGYDVYYLPDPTKKDIMEHLRLLKKKIAIDNYNSSTNLLVYVAGHGNDEAVMGGSFVPSDINTSEDNYVYYKAFRPAIDSIQAQHTLVLLDVCFGSTFVPLAGRSMSRSPRNEMSDDEYTQKNRAEKSRICIASGRREIVSDGPKDSHSPFANILLECLEDNYSKKKPLSAVELFNKLRRIKGDIDGVSPTPVMDYFGTEILHGGDFIFIPNGVALNNTLHEVAENTENPENAAMARTPERTIIVVPKEAIGINYQATLSSRDMNLAVNKVRELLNEKGFKLANYPNEVISGSKKWDEKQIVRASGATMYVEVDMLKKSMDGTNAVVLTLSCANATGGNTIYYKSNSSGYFRTDDYDVLTGRALRDISNEFISAIQAH